ncbi:MAG: glycosyltransferase [Candidatus Aminicenantes bacterium]|nr:glycosyltransferase [Candidatus Aminicenantes bacterium]
METPKVALVHDWLTGQRGGEKVLEVFAEIFPTAPIYTLFHFQGSQAADIEKRLIHTSFIQRLPLLKKRYRFYLPLFPLAVELFDFQEYDMIVSTSHCAAKGAIPNPDALHICYVHSPMRYAWNQYFSYFAPDKLGFFARRVIPPVMHRLRIWDESSSHRVDHFVANSRSVAARIQKYYRRAADVIHPPVDTDLFYPGEKVDDYFLIVSALVPYKKIDLAVRVFNQNGLPLRIVGQGPDYKGLKRMAKSNIRFMGALSYEELRRCYQEARALIMPGEEDFGINALESQACGVPVIAYGRGGATETVIPEETGLLFSELSVAGLLAVLDKFPNITFNKKTIRANALNFSRDTFKRKALSFFNTKWVEHVSEQ